MLCSVSAHGTLQTGHKHAKNPNFCNRGVDFVVPSFPISITFPHPIKYTLQLSSITTHQQTCPTPTLCNIFMAMFSNAGSPHQGSPGWRRHGDRSNCHFSTPKPPELFLETQQPLSHKPATVTWVEEPVVENLKTWTKDRSSGKVKT